MHREAYQISEVPTVGLELWLGMVLEPPQGGQRCGLMALVPVSESSEGPTQSMLGQKSGTPSFGPSASLRLMQTSASQMLHKRLFSKVASPFWTHT